MVKMDPLQEHKHTEHDKTYVNTERSTRTPDRTFFLVLKISHFTVHAHNVPSFIVKSTLENGNLSHARFLVILTKYLLPLGT